jgi:limonene 1,2-monooxygenase
MAERMVNLGAIIGTPDEAVDRIRKLQEISGGFGCLLGLAHEWTTWEKTLHSYELLARYVMPQFQDSLSWIDRSAEWSASAKGTLMDGAKNAVLKAITDHASAKEQIGILTPTPGLHRITPEDVKAGE